MTPKGNRFVAQQMAKFHAREGPCSGTEPRSEPTVMGQYSDRTRLRTGADIRFRDWLPGGHRVTAR